MAATDTLDGVYFVNPNAAQARSRRRVKLTAARARLAALAASGGGAFSLGDGAGVGPCVSEKEVRKQQRMLRNRESAALSRKRKSDRIGELEIQVEALQEENRRLRQRIDGGGGIGGGVAGNTRGITASPPPALPTTAPPPAPPPAPPRAAWAPTNVAAMAALSATSIIVPFAHAAHVVPATPLADNNDLDAANHFSRVGPDDPIAAYPSCSAAASSSSFPSAKACFNISRPAVFA